MDSVSGGSLDPLKGTFGSPNTDLECDIQQIAVDGGYLVTCEEE